MNKEDALTAEMIEEILDCDPQTGICRWKKRLGQRTKVGAVAGSKRSQDGYVMIQIYGFKYLLHRIIWLIVHREWPPMDIDHWDRDPSNNAIWNLRLATDAQNSQNGPVRKTNRIGLKGVSERPNGKFQASICVNRQNIYLGVFDTKEGASRRYQEAAVEHHQQFARVA